MRSWLFAAALLVAPLKSSVMARATRPASSRAAAWFHDGRARYAAKEYQAALHAFVRSYDLDRSPAILVDIAQCLRALGREADAAIYLQGFLDSSAGSPRVRLQVFELLDEIRVHLPAPPPAPLPAARTAKAAAEHFRLGQERYAKGEWSSALAEFRAAWRKYPSPAMLVNIAQCLRRLDQPAESLSAYRTFLERGAGTPRVRLEVFEAYDDLRRELDRRMYALAEAAALFGRWLDAGRGQPAALRIEIAAARKDILKELVTIDQVENDAP
jgi:tetratricopeptide (TPR) repeat protein